MRAPVIVLLLALGACCKQAPVAPPKAEPDVVVVTPPDEDLTVPEASLTSVGRACRKLRAMGCPEGERTSKGVTCSTVLSGAVGFIDPLCITAATSKEGLKGCNVRCVR